MSILSLSGSLAYQMMIIAALRVSCAFILLCCICILTLDSFGPKCDSEKLECVRGSAVPTLCMVFEGSSLPVDLRQSFSGLPRSIYPSLSGASLLRLLARSLAEGSEVIAAPAVFLSICYFPNSTLEPPAQSADIGI